MSEASVTSELTNVVAETSEAPQPRPQQVKTIIYGSEYNPANEVTRNHHREVTNYRILDGLEYCDELTDLIELDAQLRKKFAVHKYKPPPPSSVIPWRKTPSGGNNNLWFDLLSIELEIINMEGLLRRYITKERKKRMKEEFKATYNHAYPLPWSDSD